MTIFAVRYEYGSEAEAARTEHRPKHREWLLAQAEAGVVVASGPFVDGSGALLIFQGDDEAAVREILAHDPMTIGGGVTGMTILEWNPLIGQLSSLMS